MSGFSMHFSEGSRIFKGKQEVSLFFPVMQGQLGLQFVQEEFAMKAAKSKLWICFFFSSSGSANAWFTKIYKWYDYQVSKQYDITTLFTLLPKATLDGTHN